MTLSRGCVSSLRWMRLRPRFFARYSARSAASTSCGTVIASRADATPPLQPGFAGLYRALKLPVVPVAVDSGRLWPRGRFVKRPGIVTMRFLEPIEPGLPRTEIEARVHAAINALEP